MRITLRKMAVVAAVVGALTVGAVIASAALVDEPGGSGVPAVAVGAPDGDTGQQPAAGPAAPVVTACGADIGTTVRTDTVPAADVGPGFTTLSSTTVFVPVGTTRCVLVTFSAETACTGDVGAGNDICYVRVVDVTTG